VRAERILVVDDDEALRETLAEVLSDEGYDVVAVGDGAAALEHVGDSPTDLIILDVMLPRMDAYSFRAAQLEAQHHSTPPVIVLSAVPDLASAATRLKAAAWIAKPFRLDELLSRIRETLDRKPARASR
jgi:DNA-binding response OmpR family regulator